MKPVCPQCNSPERNLLVERRPDGDASCPCGWKGPYKECFEDDTTGYPSDERCPLCGCRLLVNKRGDRWCSFIQCKYGLEDEPRAKIQEIKPHEATDIPTKEMLKELSERKEPIDGALVLLFDANGSPELHNSGVTQMELTYLLAFLQSHTMDALKSRMIPL